jgi:hypothetical protein
MLLSSDAIAVINLELANSCLYKQILYPVSCHRICGREVLGTKCSLSKLNWLSWLFRKLTSPSFLEYFKLVAVYSGLFFSSLDPLRFLNFFGPWRLKVWNSCKNGSAFQEKGTICSFLGWSPVWRNVITFSFDRGWWLVDTCPEATKCSRKRQESWRDKHTVSRYRKFTFRTLQLIKPVDTHELTYNPLLTLSVRNIRIKKKKFALLSFSILLLLF